MTEEELKTDLLHRELIDRQGANTIQSTDDLGFPEASTWGVPLDSAVASDLGPDTAPRYDEQGTRRLIEGWSIRPCVRNQGSSKMPINMPPSAPTKPAYTQRGNSLCFDPFIWLRLHFSGAIKGRSKVRLRQSPRKQWVAS